MADTAAAALAAVDNMNIVKVTLAVAEFCVNRCFGETEQVLFMAGKARAIDAFLVGDVDFGRIVPTEHAEII